MARKWWTLTAAGIGIFMLALTLIRQRDFVDASNEVIVEVPETAVAAPELELAA
jgi:hypothetical protein